MFLAAFISLTIIPPPSEARIHFSGLDLAEDNRLLFKAVSSGGGADTQDALFLAQLDNRSVSVLNAFPQRMELIEEGRTLLVHNVFGSLKIPVSGGLPQAFPAFFGDGALKEGGFPSFTGTPGSGAESTAASPNGRWLLYIEPTSHARGTLILIDSVTGNKQPVSFGIERPGHFFPALWSGDSRTFLYARGGRLYFYTVDQELAPPAEQHRIIGQGTISSLYWGAGGFYYYFRGSNVFRIRSSDLVARNFSATFLEPGEIIGRIPFEFDPNFDRFWVAPNGRSLILSRGGANIFYYPLVMAQEALQTNFASLPHIVSPWAGARVNVLWSADGIATVIVSSGDRTLAYRLGTRTVNGRTSHSFELLETPPAFQALLSPDGRRVLFWGKNGLNLYDYRDWRLLSNLGSDPVYSALWLGNNEAIAGGGERIESIHLSGNNPLNRRLICLASVSVFGFEDDIRSADAGSTRRILASSGALWYSTDGESPWTIIQAPRLREAVLGSAQYRVYLERSFGFFENIPMVRNITAVGTFTLFDAAVLRGFTAPDEVIMSPELRSALASISLTRNPSIVPAAEDNYVFTHGNRGVREIALCFDLYSDASGLWTVLDTLARYNIRATFFVNGDFIRRHPQAVRDLAASDHEIGSMFHTPLDLSDSRFSTDRDFITQGLARNEDEFNRVTGKELSLLWHPPFYNLSREIAEAAAAVGYRNIGRDVDARDWVRNIDARRLEMGQPLTADMIDIIMDAKQGGSIIPIRLGILEGGRPDYLFNSLEVLLDALLREGFSIVTVSTMLDRL